MVLFAMLVFGLLAMAALTIDIGLANLTQAQMQTAADTAALEGLRLRDFHRYRSLSNEYRRPRVSELVRMVFDDDLHPTLGIPATSEVAPSGHPAVPPDNEDEGRFSAGPIVRLVWSGLEDDQVPDTAIIDAPGPGDSSFDHYLDDPELQSNLRNKRNGDMLSGTYLDNRRHHEIDDYDRDDFVPAATALEGKLSLGFLVRMRRTNIPDDPGDHADRDPGISSAGLPIPFLFGLGSAMHAAGGNYDPRFDGLTVRATAIAVARPALTVGLPPLNPDGTRVLDRRNLPNHPILGVGPIALTKGYWRDTVTYDADDPSLYLDVSTEGELRLAGAFVGRFISGSTSVGESLTLDINPFTPDPFVGGGPIVVYFPIFSGIDDSLGVSQDRIVGFGYGEVLRRTLNPDGSGKVSVRKRWGFNDQDIDPDCNAIVAPDNASAQLPQREPTLTKAEWDRVFAELVDLCYYPGTDGVARFSYRCDDIRPGTVFAPALAR